MHSFLKKFLAFALAVIMLVPGSVFVACAPKNANDTNALISGEKEEYVLTEDYTLTDKDCENIANGVALDLDGKVLDFDNKTLGNLSATEDIVISNGTIVNADMFFASVKSKVVLNNITVGSDTKTLRFAGNLELIGTNVGEIEIADEDKVTYEAENFEEIASTSSEDEIKTVTVDANSCIGNLIISKPAYVQIHGFVANVIVSNKADYSAIQITDNANVGNIYVLAKEVLILASEGSFVDNAFGADTIVNTVTSPSIYVESVEEEELEGIVKAIPQYTFKSSTEATCVASGNVVLSYNETETATFKTKANHKFGEGVLVEQENALLDLYDYECEYCGYKYRSIAQGSFVLEDCENVVDLLSLCLQDFNYDFSFAPGTAYGDIVINGGYIHVLCENGHLTGAFLANYKDGEADAHTIKAYIDGQDIYFYTDLSHEITLRTTVYDFLMDEIEALVYELTEENIAVKRYVDAAFDATKRLILIDGIMDTAVYDVQYIADSFCAALESLVPAGYIKYLQFYYPLFEAGVDPVTEEEIAPLFVTAVNAETGNTSYTLDVERVIDLLKDVFGTSVEKLIDKSYGKNTSDKLEEFLLALPTMDVTDFMDMVMDFSEAYGVSETRIFNTINDIGFLVFGDEAYLEICNGDIRNLLNENYNKDKKYNDVTIQDLLVSANSKVVLADVLTKENVEKVLGATPAQILGSLNNPYINKILEIIDKNELADAIDFAFASTEAGHFASISLAVKDYGSIAYEKAYAEGETEELAICTERKLSVAYDHTGSDKMNTKASFVCDLGFDGDLDVYVKELSGMYKVTDLLVEDPAKQVVTDIEAAVEGQYLTIGDETAYYITGFTAVTEYGTLSIKANKYLIGEKEQLAISEIKVNETEYGKFNFIAEYDEELLNFASYHLDAELKGIPDVTFAIDADLNETFVLNLFKAAYKKYGFDISYQRALQQYNAEKKEFEKEASSIALMTLIANYTDPENANKTVNVLYYQTEGAFTEGEGEEVVSTPVALNFAHINYTHKGTSTEFDAVLNQEIVENAYVLTDANATYAHGSTTFEAEFAQKLEGTVILSKADLEGVCDGKEYNAAFAQKLEGETVLNSASASYLNGTSSSLNVEFAQTLKEGNVLNKVVVDGKYANKETEFTVPAGEPIEITTIRVFLDEIKAAEISATFEQTLDEETNAVLNKVDVNGFVDEKVVNFSFRQTVENGTVLSQAEAEYRHYSDNNVKATFNQTLEEGKVLNAVKVEGKYKNDRTDLDAGDVEKATAAITFAQTLDESKTLVLNAVAVEFKPDNKIYTAKYYETAAEATRLYNAEAEYTHYAGEHLKLTFNQTLEEGKILNKVTAVGNYENDKAKEDDIKNIEGEFSFVQTLDESKTLVLNAVEAELKPDNKIYTAKYYETAAEATRLYNAEAEYTHYAGEHLKVTFNQTLEEGTVLNKVTAVGNYKNDKAVKEDDIKNIEGEFSFVQALDESKTIVLNAVAASVTLDNKNYTASYTETVEEETRLYKVSAKYTHNKEVPFSLNVEYSETETEVYEDHPILRGIKVETEVNKKETIAGSQEEYTETTIVNFAISEDDSKADELQYNFSWNVVLDNVLGKDKKFTTACENEWSRDHGVLLHNYFVEVDYCNKMEEAYYDTFNARVENVEIAENVAPAESEANYKLKRTTTLDANLGAYKDAARTQEKKAHDVLKATYVANFDNHGTHFEDLVVSYGDGMLFGQLRDGDQIYFHGKTETKVGENTVWTIVDAYYRDVKKQSNAMKFKVGETTKPADFTYQEIRFYDVTVCFNDPYDFEIVGKAQEIGYIDTPYGYATKDNDYLIHTVYNFDFEINPNLISVRETEDQYYVMTGETPNELFVERKNHAATTDGHINTVGVEITTDTAFWDVCNLKALSVVVTEYQDFYHDCVLVADFAQHLYGFEMDLTGDKPMVSAYWNFNTIFFRDFVFDKSTTNDSKAVILDDGEGNKLYKTIATEYKIKAVGSTIDFEVDYYKSLAQVEEDGIARCTLEKTPVAVIPYVIIELAQDETGFEFTISENIFNEYFIKDFSGIFNFYGTEYLMLETFKEQAKRIENGEVFFNNVKVSMKKNGTKATLTFAIQLAVTDVVLPAYGEENRDEVIDNVAIDLATWIDVDTDLNNFNISVSYDFSDLLKRFIDNFNAVTKEDKDNVKTKIHEEYQEIREGIAIEILYLASFGTLKPDNKDPEYGMLKEITKEAVDGLEQLLLNGINFLYYDLATEETEFISFQSIKTEDENGDFVRKTTLTVNFKDEYEFGEVEMKKVGTTYTATVRYNGVVYFALAADITEDTVQIIPLVLPCYYGKRLMYAREEAEDVSKYGFVLVLDKTDGVYSVNFQWSHYDTVANLYVAATENSLRVKAEYNAEGGSVENFNVDFSANVASEAEIINVEAFFDAKDINTFDEKLCLKD